MSSTPSSVSCEPDREARGAGPPVDVVLAHVGPQADRPRLQPGGQARHDPHVLRPHHEPVEHQPGGEHRGHLHLDDVELAAEQTLRRDLDPRADRVVDDARRGVVDERRGTTPAAGGRCGPRRWRRRPPRRAPGSSSSPQGCRQLGEVLGLSIERVVEGCRDASGYDGVRPRGADVTASAAARRRQSMSTIGRGADPHRVVEPVGEVDARRGARRPRRRTPGAGAATRARRPRPSSIDDRDERDDVGEHRAVGDEQRHLVGRRLAGEAARRTSRCAGCRSAPTPARSPRASGTR